jgi:hypothetical protein
MTISIRRVHKGSCLRKIELKAGLAVILLILAAARFICRLAVRHANHPNVAAAVRRALMP